MREHHRGRESQQHVAANEMMQELLEVFRAEATELFDALAERTAAITGTEGEVRREAVKGALRLAHNLKGASGSVGLDAVSHLAHSMEDAFSALCDPKTAPSQEVTCLLREAVVVAQLLCERSDDEPSLEKARGIEQRLRDLTPGKALADGISPVADVVEGPSASPAGSGEPEPGATSSDGPAPRAPSDPSDHAATYVRVPTGRLEALAGHLDELLALHGQLEIQHQLLQKTLSEADGAGCFPSFAALKGLGAAQRKSHSTLSRLVSELTATLQRIRTVPLTTVAPQWRRVVRDCAQSLDKVVELHVHVGDTEVDKQVLDQLRDAVVHLLRNAVDHGIEGHEERHLLGKPPTGSISLAAQMAGANVLLEVSDDGRGLEPDELVATALARQLVTADQAARMTDAEKLDLIFRDGFSTSANVSTISGRGVGLAAVREDVTRLGGSYGVSSPGYGEGTTFSLKVPISVLATRGLMVRVANVAYMLPIDAVERALRTTGSQIRTIDGSPVLPHLGSEPLPLLWLPGTGSARLPGNEALDVVVLAIGTERVGLVVSEVLDEQEYVTRRLPWNLQRVPGVNGVVILPDGSVAIALDVPFILEDKTRRDARPGMAAARAPAEARRTNILVVDDSLTNRTLERNMLVNLGYSVEVAVDGREAWAKLQQRTYDLLVTDVQMPEMDGLELTRRVRADQKLRQLPIILVTSRGRQSDIEQGAAAGADEYLVKGQFDQDKLLQAVERHLFERGLATGTGGLHGD
ncbi:MAG: response regulator [Polyangiaceae bacterium]|nr:response regulator [Polyangiaceae bacterium]